jgi:hypothetical protein
MTIERQVTFQLDATDTLSICNFTNIPHVGVSTFGPDCVSVRVHPAQIPAIEELLAALIAKRDKAVA